LAVLEEISRRFVGWPARAVEYRRAVSGTASLNHLRPRRSSVIDLRHGDAIERLDTSFDLLPRSVDMRSIDSRRTVGRHHLQNIGLFVCRRKIDSATLAPMGLQTDGKATFDSQGIEVPLHVLPQPESSDETIAKEVNLPVPLTRKLLRMPDPSTTENPKFGANPDHYGIGKSLFIIAKYDETFRLIPAEDIYVTPLTAESEFFLNQCFYRKVLVDPETGRAAFHPDASPSEAWSTFHLGKVARIGGGEYQRQLSSGQITHRVTKGSRTSPNKPADQRPIEECGLIEAMRSWTGFACTDLPDHSVIEIADNEEYLAEVHFTVPTGKTFEIRSANLFRSILQVPDVQSRKEQLRLTGESNSHLILDGIFFSQGTIRIDGKFASVTIRHCTFLPDRAEIVLNLNGTEVRIEKSHVGPITVRPADNRPHDPNTDPVHQQPISLIIRGCSVDGRRDAPVDVGKEYAIAGQLRSGGPTQPTRQIDPAHAVLTIDRTTVLGEIAAIEVATISDSILVDQVCIENTQRGCIRYSYVAGKSCTPQRYQCQPEDADADAPLRPAFVSQRYGDPDYMRLADDCPGEILKGASDQGEMGVYHDEFFNLRAQHLKRRIEEFIPAANAAGVLFET
jgi:hypothetical protein